MSMVHARKRTAGVCDIRDLQYLTLCTVIADTGDENRMAKSGSKSLSAKDAYSVIADPRRQAGG
jgi:hypothetical protein